MGEVGINFVSTSLQYALVPLFLVAMVILLDDFGTGCLGVVFSAVLSPFACVLVQSIIAVSIIIFLYNFLYFQTILTLSCSCCSLWYKAVVLYEVTDKQLRQVPQYQTEMASNNRQSHRRLII